MGEHKHKSKDSKKKSKKEHREHKHHKKSSSKKGALDAEPDVDYSDPSLWVEKGADTTPASIETEKKESSNREGWMLDESFDFGSLGAAKPKQEELKPHPEEIKISERELNPHLRAGLSVDNYPKEKTPTIKFGDAGSNWRMMKLKRVMEQAKEEGRTVEEIGLKRYGSHEKLQEALDERAYLDGQKKRGSDDRHRESRVSDRYMFTDSDAAASQKNFRRPGARDSDVDEFGRQKRQRRSASPQAERKKVEEKASKALVEAAAKPVHTPVIITQHELPGAFSSDEPTLTRDELNKLNSKLVKARLMGSTNVEELEKEYDKQLQRFEAAQDGAHMTSGGKSVTVVPTVDSEGRLYDYALPSGEAQPTTGKKRYEGTHDKTTGERLKYSSADNAMTVLEMYRQEKAGSRQSTNMDLEFANRIAKDSAYENNLDYMDERADVMASRKGMSEENKMRQAIKDSKRTQATLEACTYCFHDDTPPQCAMVSLGTRTYLALPTVQELVPGHCIIAPLEHATSMLQCDDDVWQEIRNFQKRLMLMFHEKDCGVIFMETVTNLRKKRHTMIEAIPIPYGHYEDAPMYFKEAIMSCEGESSQHKQLISTSPERGFRYSMVKELPYFHVWYELDKGYGHVIENAKEFPYWFGKEVIAGMLDIGPERWRRPKYHPHSDHRARQTEFLKDWEAYDWTKELP